MEARHFIIHRALGLGLVLVALAACTRSPLDSSASSPPAAAGPLSNGQIGVTLYNGSLPNGSGYVDLTCPDGSKQSLNAAPSCSFTALTQSGAYRVAFRDQAAAQPAYSAVTLGASAPSAQVALQVGGASLQVSPAPFQGLSYAFAPAEFNYYVHVDQAPADAQDLCLDVDPNTLPPGWSYRFGDPVVRGNASTTLAVLSAEGSTPTAVALRVRALMGSVERLSQGLTLQRNWSLGFSSSLSSTARYSQDGEIYCTAIYLFQGFSTGMPGITNAYLRCSACPGTLDGDQGVGLLLPLDTAVNVGVITPSHFCGAYTVSLVVGTYVSPPQTL